MKLLSSNDKMNILQFIIKLLFKERPQTTPLKTHFRKPFFKKFSVGQFIHSDTAQERKIDNSVENPRAGKALLYTICSMEGVRRLLGVDLTINSGYRCKKLNTALWGAKKSQHMEGEACDFACSLKPKEVCEIIKNSEIAFDQLLNEGTWTHISFTSTRKPRRQFLDKSI